MIVKVLYVDPNTMLLGANANTAWDGDGTTYQGAITQDGFSIVMQVLLGPGGSNPTNCSLQFNDAASGFLRGALDCGNMSFPASTPLP
jgi:hypothetical protein